jgi:hypothetical protein
MSNAVISPKFTGGGVVESTFGKPPSLWSNVMEPVMKEEKGGVAEV